MIQGTQFTLQSCSFDTTLCCCIIGFSYIIILYLAAWHVVFLRLWGTLATTPLSFLYKKKKVPDKKPRSWSAVVNVNTLLSVLHVR